MNAEAKKYLLVIEPDDDIRTTILQDIADKMGMKALFASDGVTAYQKCRNQKFDVILSDWTVPKITGTHLIATVRETKTNIQTPILIFTKEIEEAKIGSRGTILMDYLPKTSSIEKIVEKLKALSELDPNKKQFKLDVDFINPFIDTTVRTLSDLCKLDGIKAMRPYLLNENDVLDIDISGTLVISSPYFKGMVAISFTAPVYKSVISRMISESVENINVENQDGVAEIINIIFGNTKAILNQNGYELERAIPAVMRGQNHKVNKDSKIPVLLVPFESTLGKFFIQICVKAI